MIILNIFKIKISKLLNKSSLYKGAQYMIKSQVALQKYQFKINRSIQFHFDLVNKTKQYLHVFTLDYPSQLELILDIFQYDKEYELYEQIQKKILTKQTINDDKSVSDQDNNRIKDNLNEVESKL
ncbi:unnamed protein product [Rotaria sp. Silwood1]|nr:unnamed protein product [Rotaria sp. Silwood1]CAF3902263.1 unnamed protein product [Rotaria sp. Silwood1]